MQEQDNIPNWMMFGTSHVQIQLFRDDEEETYQAALLIFLDSGEDSDQNVTIFTEIYHEDPHTASKMAFMHASSLFDNMNPVVMVWDEDMTEHTEIDLRKENMVPSGQVVH